MTIPRVRKRVALIGTSLVMILGQAILAGPVAAVGPWTPASTLVPASNLGSMADLSAAGGYVAAAWISHAWTPQETVWVRESIDSGTTWLPAVRLAADPSVSAQEISLASDAASGMHYAVWQEGSTTFMSTKVFGSGSWSTAIQISDSVSESAEGAAIVVTPAYYFLTYSAHPGDGSSTARLRIFDRATGTWAPSTALAPNAGFVELAATPSTIAAVWAAPNGTLKLRRGTIGSGSSPAITWTTSSLGSIGGGYRPFIALSGARGVVGWSKNGDVFTRRTTNSGVTWSSTAKVLDGTPTNGFSVGDAAMSGLNVVFTGARTGQGSPGYEPGYSFRMTSANGGAAWAKTTTNPTPRDARQVAYVKKPSSGAVKVVAEAWTSDNVTGAPIKQMYHRQT